MKFTMVALASAILFPALALASALPDGLASGLPNGLAIRNDAAETDLAAKYTISDLRITGEIGGHQVDETGTIQQVVAKLKARYPETDIDTLMYDNSTASDLEGRDLPGYSSRTCGCDGYSVAWYDHLQDGIGYLRNNGLVCNTGALSCNRVSCGNGAGIYVCNDNDREIQPTCYLISQWAMDLAKNCAWAVGRFGAVCGEQFTQWAWNVRIRGISC